MLLKKGSKGKEVKDLQEFLDLVADGVFGSKTEAAVKKWQWENGLVDDGIVGPETYEALGLKSKQALIDLLEGKRVVLKTIKDKTGKYGRYLGILYILDGDEWVDINQTLINEGYAKQY